MLNLRRDKFQDPRVREALGLAMDYEWMNRQMFYGAYQRVNGLFGNTACAASGAPSPEELALMEPLRKHIPPAAFGTMTTPPRTDGDQTLRGNLRRAQALFKEAGWEVRDGALRNAKGEPFVFEYLESGEGRMATTAPWIRNLQKLGVQMNFRAVDFALYQQRMDKVDYDMISLAYQGTHNPGQEFADMFGSKAAGVEGSGNYPGLQNPAVDALITRMTSARTKEELLPACRALERVIAHSHVLIPQWTAGTHRMAYSAKRLAKPEGGMPPYAQGEGWVMDTWWSK